jgi:uncharacterized phage-associated protein
MEGRVAVPLDSLFDELKSAQIAGIFLNKNCGHMNYMKLIKLMYLSERMSFELYGRPMTGDEFYNLPNGQILSTTLDLIKGTMEGEFFPRFFSKPRGFQILILEDPSISKLSKADVKILETVYQKYGNLDQWQLSKICHELPEWENPGFSRLPIPYERLMKVLNFTDEEIDQSINYIQQWHSV